MDIIEKLQWRYATKKFNTSKKIPQVNIETIKNAFNLTATSYGLQPVTMFVIENEDLKKNIEAAAFNQQQVGTCSHVLVFAVSKTIDQSFIEAYFNLVKDIRNTPEEILTPFRNFLIEDFEKKSDEETHVWASKQAYLALGNLLTVCALEGIDACPMEGFEIPKVDDILALEKRNLTSVLLMPIGYRADDDMFAEFKKVRKNTTDTVIEL